ncbi:MAG: SIS domain-containing protein, partial [Sphingobacteriales bacterium]
MTDQELIHQQLSEAHEVLGRFLSDKKNTDAIAAAANLMRAAIQNGGKIISCGNGGSM